MKYTYICKKNKQKKKLRNRTKKQSRHTKHTKKSKHNKPSLNHKSKNINKTQKKQKGGATYSTTDATSKEKFEVHSLKNFDFDKYKISKGANIDWGIVGGPPPEPDCCIC